MKLDYYKITEILNQTPETLYKRLKQGRHNEGRPEKEDALLCQLIRTQKTTLPRVLPYNMCYEACISMDEDIFS